MGSGSQYISWISLIDLLLVLEFLIQNVKCSGVYNLSSPCPITYSHLINVLVQNKDIGRTFFVRKVFRIPSFILRLIMDEAALLLLNNQLVYPRRLMDEGYVFRKVDFEDKSRN